MQRRRAQRRHRRRVPPRLLAHGLHLPARRHHQVFDGNFKVKFHNAEGDIEWAPASLHVDGRIALEHTIFGGEFQFLKEHAGARRPKLTIPSPSMVHYRGGRAAIDESVYPDMEQFWDDLAPPTRGGARAWASSDAPTCSSTTPRWPTSTIPSSASTWRDRRRRRASARDLHPAINEALAGRPAGMAVTTHMCRGNFRSSWVA